MTGWATNISAGPADESGQTVQLHRQQRQQHACSACQPAVAGGTLTFTPAANADGIATVTLASHDDGGTANGGVDGSATQTFTITVTAVNDAPTIDGVASRRC